jgi:hypothetical protein
MAGIFAVVGIGIVTSFCGGHAIAPNGTGIQSNVGAERQITAKW